MHETESPTPWEIPGRPLKDYHRVKKLIDSVQPTYEENLKVAVDAAEWRLVKRLQNRETSSDVFNRAVARAWDDERLKMEFCRLWQVASRKSKDRAKGMSDLHNAIQRWREKRPANGPLRPSEGLDA